MNEKRAQGIPDEGESFFLGIDGSEGQEAANWQWKSCK